MEKTIPHFDLYSKQTSRRSITRSQAQIDNTLSSIDTKKFGNLFLVNPIHPNAGYVLSAPTVIRPDYADFTPPYYSASIPFVASSVVLRTLGGFLFIAVYEVNAQVGQPQVINNLTTAEDSSTVNNTK